MRMMSLRQKVIILSTEEGGMYDVRLIQNRFLHTILTGLQNDYLRASLKPWLKPDISDEILLQELTLLVSDETEHEVKTAKKKKSDVSTSVVNAQKSNSPELEAIKALTASVSAMKVEIESLKKSIGHNDKPPTPGPNPKAPAFEPRQLEWQDFRCLTCREKNLEYCNHCFRCGSSDHIRRDCHGKVEKN